MKLVRKAVLLYLLASGAFFSLVPFSRATDGTAPVSNQGKKWRIGYLQQGENKADYAMNLLGLFAGLERLGWVEDGYIPPRGDSTEIDDIWQWLSEKVQSDYIQFVGDAYWNSDGDATLRQENAAAVIERLNKAGDIDLMIAMGTLSGEDLANDRHSTNTMVMDASNPVASGIVKSAEYSGRPYMHAKVEHHRYKNQIEVFYRAVKFTTLGIVYVDSPDGRAFSAIDEVEIIKKKKGFSIEECVIPPETVGRELVRKVKQCYEELAPKIDAMYMTSHIRIDKEDMWPLMRLMLEHKIPTWAQDGGWEVEYGALMSFNRPDYLDAGIFQAKVMAQIFRGTPPGEISQIFVDPKSETISLNMETARRIEFNPGWDVLAAAEQVYEEIKNEESEIQANNRESKDE